MPVLTFGIESAIFLAMNENTVKEEKNIQERLNRALKELSILYDISLAMRTTLDLDHILYIILTGVTSHAGLGFNRAALFLVNSKERILEGKMAIGPESAEHAEKIWKFIEAENKDLEDLVVAYNEEITNNSPLNQTVRDFKIPLNIDDGGILAKAYYNSAPIHIRPDSISQYSNDSLLKVFKTSELVIMPLKAKDKVNGLIIADNLFTQKPIADNDLRIFTMLSNQAGLAIENAQLYEMVVHKSHTDSLTNLWNHGYFQDTLVLEISKAKYTNTPLSLLIMDIDDFKKFNDMWGHQNGDIVLSELAKILKDSSRTIDYACRYGGEEFSIILTQTNKEQALVIAERLREKIAQHNFFSKYITNQVLHLTVSIGVGSFPHDALAKEDLILKTDKAMYTAKFIGKNKTCAV